MEKISVLVVDDEKDIRDLIEIYLKNEGYEVLKAKDGMEALDILKQHPIQLVILDIMLPGMDGIKVCAKIRETWDVPILMLSAKGESTDRIQGIMTGADDYVAKPFNPLEVIVRVKALLKRYLKNNVVSVNSEIVINGLTINTQTHQVTLDGNEIPLTHKEFEILGLLAKNRGIVFSSRKIYESVWNEEFFESDSTIMTHIKNLREKLGDTLKNPRYIKTIWGVGYKIEK
ncbi:MAG: response regulator transcription factor [Clostridia bacterium]|nr:response regulator transcription factor [Clostridia bacterium]